MRRAMTRWPGRFRKIVDDRKEKWATGLDIAQNVGEVAAASENHDERIDGAMAIVSAVKTGLMMAIIDQRDDHKEAELTTPKPGINVNVNGPGVVVMRGIDPEHAP